MSDYQEYTHDLARGAVAYGVTSVREVIFAKPFPNRPHVVVAGAHTFTHYPTGFVLDRVPDEPVAWCAQEYPAFRGSGTIKFWFNGLEINPFNIATILSD